jgi:pyruvate dehydrogenase complex dehydrogenase (E1) component
MKLPIKQKQGKDPYANLQPARPGEVRNPTGYSGQGKTRGTIQAALFRRLKDRGEDDVTIAEKIANLMVQGASQGNFYYLRMLLEQAEQPAMTKARMEEEIQRIVRILTKHVDDAELLRRIATDLETEDI